MVFLYRSAMLIKKLREWLSALTNNIELRRRAEAKILPGRFWFYNFNIAGGVCFGGTTGDLRQSCEGKIVELLG